MKLVKAYNSVSLVLRIVIGMVIGAALALLIPNAAVTAPGIGILGTLFVGALKAIAPLLVFVLIISALAQSKEKLGKQFGTVIVLYLVSTFLAAVIAAWALHDGGERENEIVKEENMQEEVITDFESIQTLPWEEE